MAGACRLLCKGTLRCRAALCLHGHRGTGRWAEEESQRLWRRNACRWESNSWSIPYISHTQVAARGPFVARGVSINGPRAVLKSFFNY